MTKHRSDISVLITRPAQTAADMAQRLDDLGYSSLHAPVLAFEAIANNAAEEAESYDALIITSQNAIHALKPNAALHDIPVFCVGERTKARAVEYGFKQCIAAQGNVQDLCTLIAEQAKSQESPRRFLFLCGEDLTASTKQSFADKNINVDYQPIYRMNMCEAWPDEVVQKIRTVEHIIAPIFSQRSAQSFLALLDKHQLNSALRNIWVLCIGQDGVRSFQSLDCKGILCADRPDMDAMIDGIKRIFDKLEDEYKTRG